MQEGARMSRTRLAVAAIAAVAVLATPAAGQEGHNDAGQHDPAAYPQLDRATAREKTRARRLLRQTERRVARFDRLPRALRAGYVRALAGKGRPHVFHVRRDGFRASDRRLDPRWPEALVYWWPAQGRAILLGAMYRVPAHEPPPRLGGPIVDWHRHRRLDGGLASSRMAHLWLTGRMRTAFARCLPVAALEAVIPAFHWSRPTIRGVPEVHPCSTTPTPHFL
jgi:hypothetical protein